nr:MAG TPA: hypothetical protein [Caudoviricetes sp.]
MATTKKTATIKKVDMSDVITAADESITIDLQKTSAGAVRIEDTALINVKSNVLGELIFVDPITKAKVKWAQCGEVLQLPLSMLRNMKNGAIKFFTNQLVIITGFADENADKYEVADIYKALYITQYYKDILDPANYDEICSWTPAEIRQKVPMLSKGAKGKLVVALNTYIEKGVLDSLKAIKTFEEVLGCDLMRPE